MIGYDQRMKVKMAKRIEEIAVDVLKKREPGRYRFCVSVDPEAGETFRQLCDNNRFPVSRVIEYLIKQFNAAVAESKK